MSALGYRVAVCLPPSRVGEFRRHPWRVKRARHVRLCITLTEPQSAKPAQLWPALGGWLGYCSALARRRQLGVDTSRGWGVRRSVDAEVSTLSSSFTARRAILLLRPPSSAGRSTME